MTRDKLCFNQDPAGVLDSVLGGDISLTGLLPSPPPVGPVLWGSGAVLGLAGLLGLVLTWALAVSR